MNRNQAKDMWPIIRAFSEGQIIQARTPKGEWHSLKDEIVFNADPVIYRLKPISEEEE